MRSDLYAASYPERARACIEQAGHRCEHCGVRQGAWRISRRTHEIYLVPLHAAHINHDPDNPNAELRALCPSCHLHYDRHTERPVRTARRQGYRVVSLDRLLLLVQSAGIEMTPTETGYRCRVRGLETTHADPLDAIGFALHTLMMEARAWTP